MADSRRADANPLPGADMGEGFVSVLYRQFVPFRASPCVCLRKCIGSLDTRFTYEERVYLWEIRYGRKWPKPNSIPGARTNLPLQASCPEQVKRVERAPKLSL
jgi:hypothetical protein